jgi:beta-lactamase regulating signal transducer with metallopeptidase domain
VSLDLAGALATVGRAIADATWTGALVGGAAVLLRRPARSLPPRLQAWFWWLVAARLLVALAGVPPLEVAWLPAAEVRTSPRGGDEPAPLAPSLPALTALPTRPGATSAAPAARPASLWTVIGGLWLAGAGTALARTARAQRAVRRLVARAMPVDEPDELAALAAAARTLGVSRPVALARSSEVGSPLVVGLRRPVVVVPVAPRLAPEELRLALLHELAHVRRRDAWRALVPALGRRLLFFHPVASWAEREHSLAVEAACDAEVVERAGAPRRDYGALLVRVAVGDRRNDRPAAAFALAGPNLNRRLKMLSSPSLSPRQLVALAPLAALVVVAVAIPIRLVAAEPAAPPLPAAAPAPVAEPSPVDPPEAAAPEAPPRAGTRWVWSPRLGRFVPAPPVPAAPPAPPLPPAAPAPPALAGWPSAPLRPMAPHPPLLGEAPRPALAPMPPMPALAPMPPLPPVPPLPPALPELRGAEWLVLWQEDAKLVIDAGSWAQRRAEELGERDGRPVLLLGRDGRSWVVRDEAAIDAVRSIFFASREAALGQAEIARQAARAAFERSRLAIEASRRAAAASDRDAQRDAERVARLARLEAQRVAELQRELERLGGDELAAARGSAEAAARELERLEDELSRLRELEGSEQRLRRDAAREEHEADRERLEAELATLEERAAESRREVERRLAELERELERRLDEIFERRLAEPLPE